MGNGISLLESYVVYVCMVFIVICWCKWNNCRRLCVRYSTFESWYEMIRCTCCNNNRRWNIDVNCNNYNQRCLMMMMMKIMLRLIIFHFKREEIKNTLTHTTTWIQCLIYCWTRYFNEHQCCKCIWVLWALRLTNWTSLHDYHGVVYFNVHRFVFECENFKRLMFFFRNGVLTLSPLCLFSIRCPFQGVYRSKLSITI